MKAIRFRADAAPPARAHVVRLDVVAGDIDGFAHVNNVVYVRWVLDAAVAHSDAVGLGLGDYHARGAAYLLRAHAIEYLRPALLGDAIEVVTWIERTTAACAERRTLVRRVGELAPLAVSETTWVLVDLDTRRARRITPEWASPFGVAVERGAR